MSPVPYRSLSALVATCILAIALFGWASRGFAVVTSDGARRVDMERSPRVVPDIDLIDSRGDVLTLSERVGKGRVTIVALVYTRCTTICRVTASSEAYLQAQIRSRALDDQIRLLTLSFDPAHDTPDTLARYARRMRVDRDVWTIATVSNVEDLSRMLDVFGIVVIPDGLGGYEHNGALFVIDKAGRLAGAYDIGSPDRALADLLDGRWEAE